MRFIDRLIRVFRSPPRPDAATLVAIEQAVLAVDPLIRQVAGYERRLLAPVQCARAYCADIATRIPGPYQVNRAAFAADPLVHALFASADAIDDMLATSQCVRDHLPAMALESGQCCALLGMRIHEKAILGAELEGEMVRTDVAQTALHFTDHTLTEPSPDGDRARARLGDVLFESLLQGIAARLAEKRRIQMELRQEHSILLAKQRAGQVLDAAQTERSRQVREQLDELQEALRPAGQLQILAGALAAPEALLRLDPVELTVNHTGIIQSASAADAGSPLHFAQLSGRDQRRWVVILAMIDRADARRAMERFTTTRHYLVI